MLTVICAFVLLTLASARVTRLIVTDTISIPPRRYLIRKLGTGHWLVQIVHCSFCASVWVSFGAAAFWCAFTPASWLWFLPGALAMSHLVAPILIKFDQLDRED